MRFKWLIFLMLVPVAVSADEGLKPLSSYSGELVTEVGFTGNNVTKDHVVRRELHTAMGDTLSTRVVMRDIERLKNLGIFADVTVVVTEYTHGVGVEYRLHEMPWILPYIAFRYTEENGWAVGPAASSVNLFGQAILLSGRVLVGGITTAEVNLVWPWITGNHVNFELRAAHLVRDQVILEFEEQSSEVTPWVGTWWGKHGRLAGSVAWFQMNSDSTGRTLDDDNQDNFLRIGGRIGWDDRDSWRNPHRGWWHEVQVMRSRGSGDFWSLDVDLQRYQPLTERQTLVVGWLTTLQSGQVGIDVPSYLQYFMGGANSIRGYEFDELGRELFGKNQMILTLEYQYLVTDIRAFPVWKWAFPLGLEIAGFTDTGIAWDTDPALELDDSFSWDRAKTGVGIGLRFLVPSVDVIRVDLAVNEDGEVRFHFAVWPKLYAQRYRVR